MKSGTWNKWKRGLAGGLLAATTMLGTVVPALANEAPQAAPQISPWSMGVLNEGEKYGIFPLSWYYDGTFQKPIAHDRFQSLVQAAGAKLDALGLSKKGEFTLPSGTATITRDTVLQSLFGLLKQYELPAAFEMGKDAEPIAYLQKKGIVQGTDSGLELDQPCTVEQAAVLASRVIEYAYEAADGGAKGLFWKVTKGNNTMYLLGSIHLGIPEMYPLRKEVKDAFQSSDELLVEVNLMADDTAGLEYFTSLTSYNDGTTLKDHVSKETYEKLERVIDKLGLPKQAFDQLKPWVINSNLALTALMKSPEELAQATASGVDLHFLSSAKLAGKPVQELEGFKLQGDILSSASPQEQEKELNAVLDQLLTPDANAPDMAAQFKQWQQLWAKGDLNGFTQAFAASSQQFTQSGMAQKLLGERDKNMAKKLADLLEKDGKSTYFVVIGAAHYAVKDMVLDQLKQKGYDVQFIK
ncbi:TraB/GumN family protein [Paenibacillus elgii]|uniref:TraB/GumN family protein n=1 Tax=Paenibacillus elgii TaxID=189691 RepID=UPI000248DC6D|nr:TraB/GumN family protein [Paenibacillus elgii]